MNGGRIGGLTRQQSQLLWFLLAGYTRYDFAEHFCLSNPHIGVLIRHLKNAGWTIDRPRKRTAPRRDYTAKLWKELEGNRDRSAIIAERMGVTKNTVQCQMFRHRRANR